MVVKRRHLLFLDGILKRGQRTFLSCSGGGRVRDAEDVLRQFQVRIFCVLWFTHDGCRVDVEVGDVAACCVLIVCTLLLVVELQLLANSERRLDASGYKATAEPLPISAAPTTF